VETAGIIVLVLGAVAVAAAGSYLIVSFAARRARDRRQGR